MRLAIRPGQRLHWLIWRVHPSAAGDPGWRCAKAIDGCPIGFGERFATWADAMHYASDVTR